MEKDDLKISEEILVDSGPKIKDWATTIIIVIFFNLLGWFFMWLYIPILFPKLEKDFSYSYQELYSLKNAVNNLNIHLENLKATAQNKPYNFEALEQKVSGLEKNLNTFCEKTTQQFDKITQQIENTKAPVITQNVTKDTNLPTNESLLEKIYYKGKQGKPFYKYLKKLPNALQEHILIKPLKSFARQKILNLNQLVDKFHSLQIPAKNTSPSVNLSVWQKLLSMVRIEKVEIKPEEHLKDKIINWLREGNLKQAIVTLRQSGLEKNYQSWIEEVEKRIHLDKLLNDMFNNLSNIEPQSEQQL